MKFPLALKLKTLYTICMIKISKEKIVLAGGCFWGMQGLFDSKAGVVTSRVGYCGGESKTIDYEQVKTGATGHAESIEIVYDSTQTSLRSILGTFFQIHDPTTPNRQGNDLGSQYRSVIFYNNESQRVEAQKAIFDANSTGLWGEPIVTEVVPFTFFVEAENLHQKYLENNPTGYTCHFPRPEWVLPK